MHVLTSNRWIFLSFTLAISLLVGCGSQESNSEDPDKISVDGGVEVTDLDSEVTHEDWSTASRVFNELISGSPGDKFGMIPVSEESTRDYSEIFPVTLGAYTKSTAVENGNGHSQLTFSEVYEKGSEKLMFTLYRFETPLNMLRFFTALDSLYLQDEDLVIDEIEIGFHPGWKVQDANGKDREVCIVIDDNTFLQADVNPEFTGQLIELIPLLELE